MSYTTILFDLDNTLLDFGKAEDRAVDLMMRKYGVPLTEENKRLYITMNKDKWAALERREITREELFKKRFPEYFAAVGVEGDGDAANDDYLTFLSQGHFLIDGALETCKELAKSHELYIITNGAVKAQTGRLENSPITKYMSGVFISEKIGYDKPDKRFFDYVTAHIKEKDKSKILIVGDSVGSDIMGGINSGIDTCLVSENDVDSGANYRIDKICNILNII